MKISAIYPGTFDPITNGHSDIIIKASRLFDRVIVAVAGSTSKNTAFTTVQRTEMAKQILAPIENVEVTSFSGLVVDYAKAQGAKVIIRGLRAVSDFVNAIGTPELYLLQSGAGNSKPGRRCFQVCASRRHAGIKGLLPG